MQLPRDPPGPGAARRRRPRAAQPPHLQCAPRTHRRRALSSRRPARRAATRPRVRIEPSAGARGIARAGESGPCHHPPAPRLLRQRLSRPHPARTLLRPRRLGGGRGWAGHARVQGILRTPKGTSRACGRRRKLTISRRACTTACGSTARSCAPPITSFSSECGSRCTSSCIRARPFSSPTSTCTRRREPQTDPRRDRRRRYRARRPPLPRTPSLFRAAGVADPRRRNPPPLPPP